ncbi:hypothetical protein BU24DRAFT_490046 [Aaosphaeria arxii CBS 175.79]|uniref:Uncharacterized protein n=1 Tax=Aaosphaeria arxii CBS 175.79 TaxID=1450172 RepID=A0A6A5Y4S5_9PLEO|nr:uncharacterized protein BU24DRAFT_490046 [Aaosphaeria arxii CBS 175.79]KAF2020259.1 hypothetical protein BU24DRAFT_490046 [Aaosphaeria arxii CBS 175.79]
MKILEILLIPYMQWYHQGKMMFPRVLPQLLLFAAANAAIIARNETFTSSTTPTPTYPSGSPPEIFPTPIDDVPEEAFSCWESHVSWTSFSTVQHYADETDKSYVTHTTTETTSLVTHVSYVPSPDTTLCDSEPRVTGRQTPTGYDVSTTVVLDMTWSETWLPPTPTCTVDSYGSLCSQLHASEASIIDRISRAGFTTDFPLDDPQSITDVLKPPCNTVDSYATTPTPVTCSLNTDALTYKVLYWPVTIAPGDDFCAPSNVSRSTLEATPTIPGQPNTAKYGDLVLTSPTVYYILDNATMETYAGPTVSGASSAWRPIGTPASTPLTLSQNPLATPLSSALTTCTRTCRHCLRRCSTYALPFSLEDLATAPADKWHRNAYAYEGIYQGMYTPFYTFPQDVKTAEEQWGVCDTLVLAAARPMYLALPTERWPERNEEWTYTWPTTVGVVSTPTPVPVPTRTASPGGGSTGTVGPEVTGLG